MKKLLVMILAVWAGSAAAQESTVNIELNNIALRNDVCQVFIRVGNQSDTTYSAFKIDLAFFDKDGIINDRVLVDLAPLRARKTSIHVFDMPDLDCGGIGEVLLNDITECQAENPENTPANCFDAVTLSARGDIGFIR